MLTHTPDTPHPEAVKHGAIGHLSVDEELQQAVCEALIAAPELDSTNIGVRAASGAVTLSGSVPTEPARELALRIASEQPGVETVAADSLAIESA